tara:strand:+ start:2814 stop:3374 length:561 start_codon:yes stop_codon:yes gene_type:complete
MTYINKYDKNGTCSKTGSKAESNFSELARGKGWQIEETTKRQNMFAHIDFILKREPAKNSLQIMSVDVKSRKKTSRKDAHFNDDWIWLEFKNVQGKDGWLSGNATHIVFERENEFVLVPRESLKTWAKEEIKSRNNVTRLTIKCKAKNSKDARYKLYTRYGRQDLLTQVNYQDMISSISNIEIWNK